MLKRKSREDAYVYAMGTVVLAWCDGEVAMFESLRLFYRRGRVVVVFTAVGLGPLTKLYMRNFSPGSGFGHVFLLVIRSFTFIYPSNLNSCMKNIPPLSALNTFVALRKEL